MKTNSLCRLLLGATFLLFTLLLVVGVRNFFPAESPRPLVVEGDSMAPHFLGAHIVAKCKQCGLSTPLPPSEAGNSPQLPSCIACDGQLISAPDSTVNTGTTLELANKLAEGFAKKKTPRRWEVVLFHSPTKPKQLWLKRVVGLPGEQAALREGDVWINGQRLAKTLEQQLKLRLFVTKESAQYQHWRPTAGSSTGWQWKENGWQCDLSASSADSPVAELRFDMPITDDLAWNHRLSREVHPVNDLQIEMDVTLSENARLHIEMPTANQLGVRAVLLAGKPISLVYGTSEANSQAIWPANKNVRLVCSTFDQRAIIAIDGKTVISIELTSDSPPSSPIKTGIRLIASPESTRGTVEEAIEGAVKVRKLSVWRDVYYEQGRFLNQKASLGPNEWFVLGDNPPVSVDSRNWEAPVGLPSEAIVGIIE